MTKIIRFTLVIILSSLFISGQAQDSGKKMSQKEIALLVDSISAALQRWYIYPDKAALMAKAVKTNFKKGAYSNANNRVELSRLLHNDVQKAHTDPHLRIMYNPEFAEELMTVLPDSLLKKVIDMEAKESQARNFSFVKTEILPGNIGFVRWDGFEGNTQELIQTVNSSFQFVSNTKALIIDMRYNGGGSPETVLATLNYFFDKKVPMNHLIDWRHDTLKQITDPSKTTFKLNMPVYVLTSKRTFSGAEDFTYGLKHAGRAIIVGDTTGGGAHPTGPCCMGQGFVMNVPTARSYNEFTKTDWEGVGVLPDIYMPAEKSLPKVQALIITEVLKKTTDEQEKKVLIANLNGLRTKLMQKDSIKLSTEALLKYCGKYTPIVEAENTSPLSIMLSCDKIYRHMDNAFNKDAFLIPIAENKFLYDEDSGKTLEFIVDKNGAVTGLVTQWWTGTTQMIKKN